eukprot:2010947-Rhodomonas_salina.1
MVNRFAAPDFSYITVLNMLELQWLACFRTLWHPFASVSGPNSKLMLRPTTSRAEVPKVLPQFAETPMIL